jgi:hypothetical protein
MAIGATDRLESFTQLFWWFPRLVPANRNLQIAGLAAICWAIWKLRNRACFEKQLIKSPNELINFSVVFMNYWAGLYNPSDVENIKTGANGLLRLAAGAAATSSSPERRPARGNLRLTDEVMADPDVDNMEIDGDDA